MMVVIDIFDIPSEFIEYLPVGMGLDASTR
jgi:hypothetical protein